SYPIRAGRKRESRKRKGRKGKSPKLNLTLVSELTAPSFAKPTGARANTCCGATLLSKHQPRPDHYPFALHAARGRSPAPAQTTQTGITRAATAQNHGLRPTGQIGLRSEDFLGAWVDFERLTIDVPLESAKSG